MWGAAEIGLPLICGFQCLPRGRVGTYPAGIPRDTYIITYLELWMFILLDQHSHLQFYAVGLEWRQEVPNHPSLQAVECSQRALLLS